ncbi:BPL-N domain-containing protein [Amycolatopsis sp., V23-08]|uniref:BPL-N domain-containing protein n=1 Tax=Amycolatopsis heterodermiae TaxID=3110235 RepID=A0ABU5RLD9_9PSEU|nr:BPL-N domain-containing protein [Amycolatopsis sp., V23-08]MEA5366340.1 BPL-N domain-containing protein [Amycolatopsis sp., V23-08]
MTVSRRLVLTGAVAAGLLAACGGPAPDTRPLALVYRGKASTGACSDAVADLLRTRLRVEFCGPEENLPLTAESLAKAAVYAQPGGGSLDDGWRAMRRYADVITSYVRGGGRYLGFCLGGYLAGATPGFSLLPGDTEQYIATSGAEVRSTRDTVIPVDWQGQRRRMYFQDGPDFVLQPGASVTVLARYTNDKIAALVTPYGKGRVGVVGPHPEAPESWYRDLRLTNPDGVTPDLGLQLVDRTLSP